MKLVNFNNTIYVYLLLTKCRRILIDTGECGQKEYLTNLSQVLKQFQCTIDSIVLTHWHHDHVGGVQGVQTDVLRGECAILNVNF